MGAKPVLIPAEAGTTNVFSAISAVFVVPPSGGRDHNANCCEKGASVYDIGNEKG